MYVDVLGAKSLRDDSYGIKMGEGIVKQMYCPFPKPGSGSGSGSGSGFVSVMEKLKTLGFFVGVEARGIILSENSQES